MLKQKLLSIVLSLFVTSNNIGSQTLQFRGGIVQNENEPASEIEINDDSENNTENNNSEENNDSTEEADQNDDDENETDNTSDDQIQDYSLNNALMLTSGTENPSAGNALLDVGTVVNGKLKQLATQNMSSSYSTITDRQALGLIRATEDEFNASACAAYTEDNLSCMNIASAESDNAIYAWYEPGEKNYLRYYTPSAEEPVLNANAAYTFYGFRSGWNTGSLPIEDRIFTIDLKGFDWSIAENISNIMENTKLVVLDLSGETFGNITSCNNAFQTWSTLETVDLSNCDFSALTDSSRYAIKNGFLIRRNSGIKTVDLSGSNFDGITSFEVFMDGGATIENFNMSNVSFANATSFYRMFESSSIKNVNMSGGYAPKLTMIRSMFNNSSVETVDLTGIDMSRVQYAEWFANGASKLTTITWDSPDFSKLLYATNFIQNTQVGSLDFSGTVFSSLIGASGMFKNNPNLKNIKFSEGSFTKTTNTSIMFQNDTALTTIEVPAEFSMPAITQSTNMFDNCTSIVGGEGTVYDSNDTSATYAKIDRIFSTGVPGYFTGPEYEPVDPGDAVFDSGSNVNTKWKQLVDPSVTYGTSNTDTTITGFDRASRSEYMNSACRVYTADSDTCKNIAAATSEEPIYTWLDTATNRIKWYTVDPEPETGESMSSMFFSFENVDNYDFSNWNLDTSKAINWSRTFAFHYTAQTPSGTKNPIVDLSYFDFSGLANGANQYNSFNGMFERNNQVSRIIFPTINVDHGIYLSDVFLNASNLEYVDFGNVHVKTTGISNMFSGCTRLQNVDISGITYAQEKAQYPLNEYGVFYGCENITDIDLSNLHINSNVHAMSAWFNGCKSLKNVTFGENNDFSEITTMSRLFNGCTLLETVDLSAFDNLPKLTDIQEFFNGCTSLKSVDMSVVDHSNNPNTYHMFTNCASLAEINLSGWTITGPGLFWGCSSLKSVNFEGASILSTGYYGNNMNSMFRDCTSLVDLDLRGLDFNNVKYMNYTFANCPQLEHIWVNSTAAVSLDNATDTYAGDVNLSGNKGTAFDPANDMKTYSRVDYGSTTPGYWSANDVYLTLDPTGGSFKSTEPGTHNPDGTIVVNAKDYYGTLAVPEREGYVFAGWFTDPVEKDGTYCASFYRAPTSDTRIYAHWETASRATYAKGRDFHKFWSRYPNGNSITTGAWFQDYSSTHSFTQYRRATLDEYNTGACRLGFDKDNYMSGLTERGNISYDRCMQVDDSVYYTWTDDSDPNSYVLNTGAYSTPIYMWPANKELLWWSPDPQPYLNEDSSYMWIGMYGFDSFDQDMFDASHVINFRSFFEYNNLKTIDLTHWDVSSATNLSLMLSSSNQATSINLSGWDIRNVQTAMYMMRFCAKLETVDVSGWNVSSLTNAELMFTADRALKNVDISGWNMRDDISTERMFKECSSLETLDLSDWKAPKKVWEMFADASSLKTVTVGSKWNPANLLDGSAGKTFIGATSIVGEHGTVYSSDYDNYPNTKKILHIDCGEDSPGYLSGQTYTIHYHGNGGHIPNASSGTEMRDQLGTYYMTLDLLENQYVRNGYVFTGWYKDAACTEPFVGPIITTNKLPDTLEMDAYAGWSNYICKVTDGDGNLLYKDAAHKLPALYSTLGDNTGNAGAFGDCVQDKLYKSDGTSYTGVTYNVKMLCDYTLPDSNSVRILGHKKIILTTAEKADTNTDGYPYTGTGSQAVISAGNYSSRKSMFVVGDTSSHGRYIPSSSFVLKDITLDGNASIDYENNFAGGTKFSENGGAVRVESVRCSNVITGTTVIKNFWTAESGAAISGAGHILFVTGQITSCKADKKGGAIYGEGGAGIYETNTGYALTGTNHEIDILSGEISNCIAETGGAIFAGNILAFGDAYACVNVNVIQNTQSDSTIYYSSSEPIIENCKAVYGGAIATNFENSFPPSILLRNGTIESCSAKFGGAVYVGDGAYLNFYGMLTYKNGENVYMTKVNILNNRCYQDGNGAGIYIADNAHSIHLENALNFGGTGTDENGNILYTSGNFKDGELANATNGGYIYRYLRQDIYNAGDYNKLYINGFITAEPGSIWVQNEKNNETKRGDTFASYYTEFYKQYYIVNNGKLESTLAVFRNAAPDEVTGNKINYYVVAEDKPDTTLGIRWQTGEKRYVLRKTNEQSNTLKGAKFDICTPYKQPLTIKESQENGSVRTYKFENLETVENGLIWLGKIPYGTWLIHEKEVPSGYKTSGTNGWQKMIVNDEGITITDHTS